MRVAIDCRPLQTPSRVRGIGTYIKELLFAFAQMDKDTIDPHFIFWPDTDDLFSEIAEEIGLSKDYPLKEKIFFVNRPSIGKMQWMKDAYSYDCWENIARKVDLLHFTSPFELDFGWPKSKLSAPKIVTVHDLMSITHANLLLQGKHKLLKPVYKSMAKQLRFAQGLICVSNYTLGEVQYFLKEQTPQSQAVLLGCSQKFSQPFVSEIDRVRQKYKLPEEYILFFGGLSATKNLETLLASLDYADLPPLVVAGAAQKSVVDKLKESFPGVIWLGSIPQEDLPALYGAATVYVMPSLAEGFGLPLLEAMACGTPVACSNRPALNEVTADAAAKFEPNDPRHIAQVICELICDPQRMEVLRERGFKRTKELTFTQTARKTIGFYKKML
ncbi:glycosyltransferase family 4 protein [bacterium]|nr:glycosyltransferase family 4 protein [bacterium]